MWSVTAPDVFMVWNVKSPTDENLRSEALTQNPIADLEKSILDLGLYNLFVVVG